ncbi:MAG: superinfection immunity protein [Candidatus Acidiferrales bacterium]
MLTLIAITFLYFLPSFLARDRHNFGAIFLFNFFLGWTFVGWIVALIWACASEPRPGVYIAGAPVPVYAVAGHSLALARYCSSCGTLARADGRYCATCGRVV